jgi:RNA polymerase sigma-70 factor (ECF subfamily)
MECLDRTIDRQLSQQIPHIRRYAMSLTHSRDEAEDISQDTLERALRHHDKFETGTELRRWLFRILRNVYIDRCRRASRRGHEMPLDDAPFEVREPPRQLAQIQLKDTVKSMADLRPEERNVMLLSLFSDMDHREISQHLGIAVGTVKSRLSRARAKLTH